MRHDILQNLYEFSIWLDFGHRWTKGGRDLQTRILKKKKGFVRKPSFVY